MRIAVFLICTLGLSVLSGCPTPPEPSTTNTPGPGGPGGPGNNGGEPGPGGPGPGPGPGGGEPGPGGPGGGEQAGTPPSPGSGGEAIANPDVFNFEVIDGEQPQFIDLIGEDGETVTVTVTVTGADKGQVDFAITENDAPKVLHIERFDSISEPLTITAPATFDGALNVSAHSYGQPPMTSESVELTLDGQDKQIAITLKPFDPNSDDVPPPPPPGSPPPAPGGAPDGAEGPPPGDAPEGEAPAPEGSP